MDDDDDDGSEGIGSENTGFDRRVVSCTLRWVDV